MATQQERDAFLRGWRAAMDEVLSVLASEAHDWAEEEAAASASGEYKLPGSFALEEVRGSFKGRHELVAWITQNGPAAAHTNDPHMAQALDALVDGRATNQERALLGLAALDEGEAPPDAPDEE
ncbi:MAG: hypothetical protein ACM3N4_13460 [Nitrososphaerota archaeon]